MLDFAGKGDRAIQFVEVTEREPWFVEGLRYTGEQIKGSCLVPKRAMDVMQCEVGRVLSIDPTFYVDANPDPDLTISYKFNNLFSAVSV
jgi:coronin-7